jgi:ergothioneine biosynthesis protein EgtB
VYPEPDTLSADYLAVRQQSLANCEPLELEDHVIQPMDDASPPKWHLAHVTWFFETFLLKPFMPDYAPYNDAYEVLFNSYYNGVGEQYPRPRRGMLSRPTVAEVMKYREYVDDKMMGLLHGEMNDEIVFRTTLGLNHEQQHQELFFTDLKYNLGNNPLFPAYVEREMEQAVRPLQPMTFQPVKGGVHEIGVTSPNHFVFDNESPRHEVLVSDCEIGGRLVTNREYLDFMNDEGYARPELWLSDAWAIVRSVEGFRAPLYWVRQDDKWFEYTLGGLREVQLDAPVCHVSAYEADAYARWCGCRLPTEAEWEVAVADLPVGGNLAESGNYHPVAAGAHPVAAGGSEPAQFFGDVWEWTQSSYSAYPGFREFDGALGEYNGKFMANQLVLRGGSCVTPESHIRATYRNFFYPKDRWQFTGIRLARDPQ